jgi:hypothetical protein
METALQNLTNKDAQSTNTWAFIKQEMQGAV